MQSRQQWIGKTQQGILCYLSAVGSDTIKRVASHVYATSTPTTSQISTVRISTRHLARKGLLECGIFDGQINGRRVDVLVAWVPGYGPNENEHFVATERTVAYIPS